MIGDVAEGGDMAQVPAAVDLHDHRIVDPERRLFVRPEKVALAGAFEPDFDSLHGVRAQLSV